MVDESAKCDSNESNYINPRRCRRIWNHPLLERSVLQSVYLEDMGILVLFDSDLIFQVANIKTFKPIKKLRARSQNIGRSFFYQQYFPKAHKLLIASSSALIVCNISKGFQIQHFTLYVARALDYSVTKDRVYLIDSQRKVKTIDLQTKEIAEMSDERLSKISLAQFLVIKNDADIMGLMDTSGMLILYDLLEQKIIKKVDIFGCSERSLPKHRALSFSPCWSIIYTSDISESDPSVEFWLFGNEKTKYLGNYEFQHQQHRRKPRKILLQGSSLILIYQDWQEKEASSNHKIELLNSLMGRRREVIFLFDIRQMSKEKEVSEPRVIHIENIMGYYVLDSKSQSILEISGSSCIWFCKSLLMKPKLRDVQEILL